MRTRHILTALALPALFAACTADEFESANFEQGLQERAKLSKDFVLKTGNSVDTRYAVEGDAGISFTYEQGKDNIGAAIIDQYTPGDDPEDWKIIPSLAGNFPFAYQGGDEWKSDYELGVGHYMFVYPYNKSDNNRAAVKYELPVIQKMYETEDGPQVLNAAIEKGNKAVAVTLLKEGETLADVSMKNLFTYPKVTINFDNGEKVTTVSQVVLKVGSGQKFIVKGGFDHERVAALFGWNDDYNTTFTNNNEAFWNSTTKTVDWDKVDTYDFLLKEGGDNVAYGKPEPSDYIIVKFPNNTKVKLDANTQNKYVEARFMMPSLEDFTADNKITMYVYTDNGIYWAPFQANSFSFKSTTSEDAKKYALQRSRGNALTLKALNSDNKAPTVDNIVTTVEDWNALVDTYGNTTVGQPIAIVGTDFAFNENVKMPSKCVFTINTDVTVDGEATISNVTVNGTVTVEEGATLTTSGSFTATKVENNGTMNIAPAYNEKKEVVNYGRTDSYGNVLGVEAVINNGVLNVEEETVATFKLLNKKGAKIENKGEITISDKETDEGNFGVINNSGTINTTGFTNCAREYNTANTAVINEPTINNAEGAKILAKSGEFINKSLIVNEGVLTCKNESGKIYNDADNKGIAAVLDSKSGALTYITSNKNGKIIVYSANTSNLTIGNDGTDGIVEYTTANAKEDFKNSLVNTVIASGNLAITEGALNSLTFKKSATLTLGTTTTTATVSTLNVEAGTTTLASNMTVYTLNVAKGAMIVVPEKITLTVSGTSISNKGTILVGGTFVASNIKAEDGGSVEDNGNGEITWAATEADKNKASYLEELDTFVQAWMMNDNRGTWEQVNNILTTAGLASNSTWESYCEAVVNAYNTWKEENLTWDELRVIDAFKADVNGIIADYKKIGDDNRAKAIQAKYADNDWISSNVYKKATSETKFSDITTGSETLVSAFATKINAITKSDVKVFTEEIKNKAIYLSLQAVTANDVQESWVPAYSYIRMYDVEGVINEYELITLLKKTFNKTTYEWYSDSMGNAFDFSTGGMATVKAAFSVIYNQYGSATATNTDKYVIENSGILDYKDVILGDKWNYSAEQIATLNTAIN